MECQKSVSGRIARMFGHFTEKRLVCIPTAACCWRALLAANPPRRSRSKSPTLCRSRTRMHARTASEIRGHWARKIAGLVNTFLQLIRLAWVRQSIAWLKYQSGVTARRVTVLAPRTSRPVCTPEAPRHFSYDTRREARRRDWNTALSRRKRAVVTISSTPPCKE